MWIRRNWQHNWQRTPNNTMDVSGHSATELLTWWRQEITLWKLEDEKGRITKPLLRRVRSFRLSVSCRYFLNFGSYNCRYGWLKPIDRTMTFMNNWTGKDSTKALDPRRGIRKPLLYSLSDQPWRPGFESASPDPGWAWTEGVFTGFRSAVPALIPFFPHNLCIARDIILGFGNTRGSKP